MNNVTENNNGILTEPTPKPQAFKVDFNNIPLSLRNIPIFVMWKYVFKNGKWTKPPFQVDGAFAKTTDPLTWATYDSVKTAYEKGDFDGIGIILTGDVVGIDLDHVIADSKVKPWAEDILTQFRDTYIEHSPSGDGFHILTTGCSQFTGKRGEKNSLEVYDGSSPRYFTITGQLYNTAHTDLTNSQDELNWLAAKYDAKKNEPLVERQPQVYSKQDADSIIQAIINSKDKDKFNALNIGNPTGDHSADDLAFCNLIANFTDDIAAIDCIVRQSPFRMRDKWDKIHYADRKTYGEVTIEKALAAKSAIRAQQLANGRAQTPASQQFKFNLVSSIELTANQTPTSWLIKDLITASSLGLFFGLSGSGKSFLALDIAFCIATGIDFHGYKVTQGSVVYIAGEGYAGLKKRIKALELKYGIKAPNLFISKQSAALTDANNARDVRLAIDFVCNNASLVIIDTMHRNFGEGDENSATDFGLFINNIDNYLRKNGETVIAVHHSGHGDSDRSRGSSSIRAAMDFEYKVNMTGDLRKQQPQHITLSCTKMKDDEPTEDLVFEVSQQPIGWFDDEGVEINSLTLNLTSDVPVNKVKRLTVNQKLAIDSLKALINSDKGVHIDHWRDKFYEGCAADTTEAKRKAFQRARTDLISQKKIKTKNDYYTFDGELSIHNLADPRLVFSNNGTAGHNGTFTGHCPA